MSMPPLAIKILGDKTPVGKDYDLVSWLCRSHGRGVWVSTIRGGFTGSDTLGKYDKVLACHWNGFSHFTNGEHGRVEFDARVVRSDYHHMVLRDRESGMLIVMGRAS